MNSEKFDISDSPTPPISKVYDWQTSSDVGTFELDEPRTKYFDSSPSLTPPPPRSQKRKLSMGMSFFMRGGGGGRCRSTPTWPVVKPYQRKRHPNAQTPDSNIITFFQTLNKNNCDTYLQLLYLYTDPYFIRIHIKCTYTLVTVHTEPK